MYSGLEEPKRPVMTTASRPAIPLTPPTIRGHGVRAIDVRMGTARRGYWSAFAPTWSPVKRTTSTNEMTTTPAAAYR